MVDYDDALFHKYDQSANPLVRRMLGRKIDRIMHGAACVIAGVSLAGGQARTLKVLLGTLLIMLVGNGLNLMQVGAYAQTMAIGAILIFAMALARH